MYIQLVHSHEPVLNRSLDYAPDKQAKRNKYALSFPSANSKFIQTPDGMQRVFPFLKVIFLAKM
jgi:hypothetical protein